MLKRLSGTLPQPTAHGVGQKRVLLCLTETDTPFHTGISNIKYQI